MLEGLREDRKPLSMTKQISTDCITQSSEIHTDTLEYPLGYETLVLKRQAPRNPPA